MATNQFHTWNLCRIFCLDCFSEKIRTKSKILPNQLMFVHRHFYYVSSSLGIRGTTNRLHLERKWIGDLNHRAFSLHGQQLFKCLEQNKVFT